MTVAVATPLVEYAGNGVTLEFAAAWRFFQHEDLRVSLFDAAGTETVKAYGVHYSVDGGETDAGGTVTMNDPPPTGSRLRIERRTARSQTTDYQTNDSFPAETHERALDKDMMIQQEQDIRSDIYFSRSLRVPVGETIGEIPARDDRRGLFMGFTALGDPIALPGTGGADPGLREDLASPNGSDLVGLPSGNSLRGALEAAANARALIASTASFPVGSAIRTRDGHTYLVVSSGEHVTTDGGVKLRVLPTQSGALSAAAFGVQCDGDDDSDYWVLAFATNEPIFHPGGTSIVTRQIVYGPFALIGPKTAGNQISPNFATIRCDTPGVTPLCSNYHIYLENIRFVFGTQATTPTGSLIYASAMKVTASIGTSGGITKLTVPDGGLLEGASVGSTVVAIDTGDPTHDHEYYPSEFTSINQLYVIKEILGDTEAILFSSTAGNTVSSQSMYIRGNAAASVWTGTYQPTGIALRNLQFDTIPGFGFLMTGAQNVRVDYCYGGGHLGTFCALPEGTQNRETTGGTYHHVQIRKAMNFQLSGSLGIFSGLLDSEISQCQYDPNGYANSGVRNTYFASKIAPYQCYAFSSTEFRHNTAEDTSAPYAYLFYGGQHLYPDGLHTFAFYGTIVRFVSPNNSSLGSVRGDGNEAGIVSFAGIDSNAVREVPRIQGGRDGMMQYLLRNGGFALPAPYLTTRDFEIVTKTVTAAQFSANAGSQRTISFAAADYGGFSGVTKNVLMGVLLEHGGVWASGSGTPSFDLGVTGELTKFASSLPLTEAAGFYMDAAQLPMAPIAMVAGAGGTGSIVLTVKNGGGAGMAGDGGFVPHDMTVHILVQRVRG